jgi:hypothetical protein
VLIALHLVSLIVYDAVKCSHAFGHLPASHILGGRLQIEKVTDANHNKRWQIILIKVIASYDHTTPAFKTATGIVIQSGIHNADRSDG